MATDQRTHRTERLTVRLTPEERQTVEARARESGRPPSVLLREAALGTRIQSRPARAELEVAYQLAKIGANLNQLAHHANATGRIPTAARLHRLLDRLHAILCSLRDGRP